MEVFLQKDPARPHEKVPVKCQRRIMPIKDFMNAVWQETGLQEGEWNIFFRGKKLHVTKDDGKNATLFDYAVRPGDTLQLFRKALPQEEHHDAGDGGAGPNEGEAPVSAEPAKEEESKADEEEEPVDWDADYEGTCMVDKSNTLVLVGKYDSKHDHNNTDRDVPDGVVCRWAVLYGCTLAADDTSEPTSTLHAAASGSQRESQDSDLVAPRVKSAQPTRALAISVAAEHNFGGDPRNFLPAKNYKLLWRPMPADGDAAECFVKVPGQSEAKLTKDRLTFRVRGDAEAVGPAMFAGKQLTVGLTVKANEVLCDTCHGLEGYENCEECGCLICGQQTDTLSKDVWECRDCARRGHAACLKTEKHSLSEQDLEQLDSDVHDFYCMHCFNDPDKIQTGQLKKKKAKKPKPSELTTRNWGGGRSNSAVDKTKFNVDRTMFGQIPTIIPGRMWPDRLYCSEEACHCPPVGGIAGQAGRGCTSIVLSGKYPEDVDYGDEFWYTGSGGRDLKTGNKRTAKQTRDQTLTGLNKAITDNHNAKDWRKGIPIRVIRGSDLAKTAHGKYAPPVPEGWPRSYRYDGLYKVVQYGEEKNKDGFKVYRYLMRRDDPYPAPWTPEGQQNVSLFEGYDPTDALRKKAEAAAKRKAEKGDVGGETDEKPKKKAKTKKAPANAPAFVLPEPRPSKPINRKKDELARAIEEDVESKKLWDECLKAAEPHKLLIDSRPFRKAVEERFICLLCQNVALNPVANTPCGHPMCGKCSAQMKAKATGEPRCLTCNDPITSAVPQKKLESVLKLFHFARE